MLSGNNGILSRAQEAKKQTIISQEKEQVELAYVSVAVKKLGNDVTANELQDELDISVGENKTNVTQNEDETLNVNFTDSNHNYNVNKGVVSKEETEEEIIAKLLRYYQNEWMDEDTGEHLNIDPITDATTRIKRAYMIYDDDRLCYQGVYYKGKCFEVTFNNDLKATKVEDKSRYAIVYDERSNLKIEISPQPNMTWYDCATDDNNSQDIRWMNYSQDAERSLKELIIKVHDDYYNNLSESKEIYFWENPIASFLINTDNWNNQNFDSIIKANEIYELVHMR